MNIVSTATLVRAEGASLVSNEINEDTWVEVANPSHLELIGKIVVEFSRIEGWLCEMFRHYSRMDERASRCVTSRMQVQPMRDLLLAIIQATQTNPLLIEDAVSLLQEIGAIAEERNKIVHWEWMLGTRGPGVTRFLKSKTPIVGLPEITRYSKPELQALLGRISDVIDRIMGHIMSPEEIARHPERLRPPTPWLDRHE